MMSRKVLKKVTLKAELLVAPAASLQVIINKVVGAVAYQQFSSIVEKLTRLG
jgi:hypothetical protein